MQFEELFVPIQDHPRYIVSNYGRIVDVDKDWDVTQTFNNWVDALIVILENGMALEVYRVRDLVAEAFFVDYEPGIDIYHKNGDKHDCTVLNLTFIKPEEDSGKEKG